MKFPQPDWCPTCGQEGTLVAEERDAQGHRVVRGVFHPVAYVSLQRDATEGGRRHVHVPYWGYYVMACPAGHHFLTRQSSCTPCWCGWPETQYR